MLPSKEKLQKITDTLKDILKLKDWKVKVHVISEYEMKDRMGSDNYDTIGSVERFPKIREAELRLNKDHGLIDEMWYSTLIHELMHIHVCVLDDIYLNTTDDVFQRNHFGYESETLNCTLERIIASLYPVTNFIEGEE